MPAAALPARADLRQSGIPLIELAGLAVALGHGFVADLRAAEAKARPAA
jgi:hypothetical protein